MIRSTIIPCCLQVALAALGCSPESGDITAYGQPRPQAHHPGFVALAIVSPAPGSTHVREVVGAYGDLVALVPLEVQTSGPIARVAFVLPTGDVLGDAGDDGTFLAELIADGPVTVMAHGYDLAGRVIATDTVQFEVQPPDVSTCYDWLDIYGVEYSKGPRRDGVTQPVTVTTPINGISYRYLYGSAPRATFFMDCRLALSLARAAPHLRRRDIIEVADIGVYNYRCIGGKGTPPNCPRGMSQHAYARALDIAGLVAGDGTYYSIEDDWNIDPAGHATCQAETEAGKDRFLHDLICTIKSNAVWNIVLTPNYNAAHRDHFHVDMKDGADFIKLLGVDSGPDYH